MTVNKRMPKKKPSKFKQKTFDIFYFFPKPLHVLVIDLTCLLFPFQFKKIVYERSYTAIKTFCDIILFLYLQIAKVFDSNYQKFLRGEAMDYMVDWQRKY